MRAPWLLLPLAAACAAPQPEWVDPWELGVSRETPADESPAGEPTVADLASRTGPLGLDEVLASAEAHHPQVLMALAGREVAAGRVLTSLGAWDLDLRGRAAWDPTGTYVNHELGTGVEQLTPWWGLSLYGGWQYAAGDFAVYDGARRTGPAGEAVVGVRFPLLRGRAIDEARAGLLRTEAEAELAEVALGLTRQELLRRAAGDYWAWVASGRRLEVVRGLLRLAEDRALAVDEAVARGEQAALERAENARQVALRRGLLAGAERGLERAALALSLWLRDALGAPVVPQPAWLPALPDPAPPPDPAEVRQAVERALARRPEPRRARELARQARVELDLAENQALPLVSLEASLTQQLAGGGPDGEGGLEVKGGLQVAWPVQRRAARGRAAAARAQLLALQEQERLARERIEVEVEDAASAMRKGAERWQAAVQAAGLARTLEAAERAAQALGQSTLFLVNLREQATVEAALAVVDAAAELQQARADWAAARGEWSR